MIKNERQYRITRTQANGFALTLQSLREKRGETEGVHPLIVKAQEEALSSQLADLESEMREYEALRSGRFPVRRSQIGHAGTDSPDQSTDSARAEPEEPRGQNRGERAADSAVRGNRLRLGEPEPDQRGRVRAGRSPG